MNVLQVPLLRKRLHLLPDHPLLSSPPPFKPTDSEYCLSSRFISSKDVFFTFSQYVQFVLTSQYNEPSAGLEKEQVLFRPLNRPICLCSVNGQYMKQGKLGAAVLGNHTNKEVGVFVMSCLYSVHNKPVTNTPSGFFSSISCCCMPASRNQ